MVTSKKGKYPWRLSTLALGGLAGIILLVIVPWLGFGSVRLSRVFLGSGRWVANLAAGGASTDMASTEQERYRQQLATVTARLAETERQLATVKTSNELAEYIRERRLRSVVTTVAAYSPDPGIQSIVLQSGRTQGLQPGLAVVTEEGLMVGRIERVHDRTVTALLISDPQIRVLAKARNEMNSRGIIRGYQGLGLLMDYIPKNDTIASGQVIVTSGLDPKIPTDLVIGTIEKSSSQPGELFQQARVISPVNFNQLNVVAVILPNI